MGGQVGLRVSRGLTSGAVCGCCCCAAGAAEEEAADGVAGGPPVSRSVESSGASPSHEMRGRKGEPATGRGYVKPSLFSLTCSSSTGGCVVVAVFHA